MGELPKAIIISATIIGAALVWSAYDSAYPRFDLQAGGGLIYRLDTHTGKMWSCTQAGCWLVPIQNKTLEQAASDAANDVVDNTVSLSPEDLNALSNQAAMDAANVEASRLGNSD